MNAKSRESGRDERTTLVVGIDGSDTSWRALYYAFGQARRQGSRVIAVFVTTTPVTIDDTLIDAHATNIELAEELNGAVRALADEYHVETQFVCLSGDPVATLTKIATSEHADAIILGASQAFGHRLLGSKALRAVRRSRCPTTVVP